MCRGLCFNTGSVRASSYHRIEHTHSTHTSMLQMSTCVHTHTHTHLLNHTYTCVFTTYTHAHTCTHHSGTWMYNCVHELTRLLKHGIDTMRLKYSQPHAVSVYDISFISRQVYRQKVRLCGKHFLFLRSKHCSICLLCLWAGCRGNARCPTASYVVLQSSKRRAISHNVYIVLKLLHDLLLSSYCNNIVWLLVLVASR